MENKINNIKEIIIKDILIPALQRLYNIDYDNIKNGVSERNICARLSHHMENIMREYDSMNTEYIFSNYYVDVEYNRMGNGNLKKYENTEHRPKYMVSDLLIHSRGPERNLLAVEMKRKSNKKKIKEDKERLISIVSSSTLYSPLDCVYDTLVGVFIEFSPKQIEIDMFENIEGKGGCTEHISINVGTFELNSVKFNRTIN